MRHQLGYALINLAVAYKDLGYRDRAYDALYEGLSVSREIGDESLTSSILSDLADMEREDSRYADAREHFEEAKAIARETEADEARVRLSFQVVETGALPPSTVGPSKPPGAGE